MQNIAVVGVGFSGAVIEKSNFKSLLTRTITWFAFLRNIKIYESP